MVEGAAMVSPGFCGWRKTLAWLQKRKWPPTGGHSRSEEGLDADLRRRVFLREPPDQAFDPFLLDDAVELGAVGEHEAHALDADVVDLPALAGLAHLVVHLNRPAAGARGKLVTHGRLVAVRLVAGGQQLRLHP